MSLRPPSSAGGAIPLLQGGTRDLLEALTPTARALLATARRAYSPPGVMLADGVSRRWLRGNPTPYLSEIDALASIVGEAGLHMLNLSYEWGCTTRVAPTQDGERSCLWRTLDWPFDGLGKHVAVLDASGEAGRYFSVTWPGFAGVLTAMAPGRFSLAINQAKSFHGRMTRLLEWPVNRFRFLRSRDIPPTHVARLVCETAPDYETARQMLCAIPITLPVFFTLSGVHPNQGCLIERLPHRAHVHEGKVACANHWFFPGAKGETPTLAARIDAASPFGKASAQRQAAILAASGEDGFGLEWLTPPILTSDTRIACVMDAGRGEMAVVGMEADGGRTEILRVKGQRPLDPLIPPPDSPPTAVKSPPPSSATSDHAELPERFDCTDQWSIHSSPPRPSYR